LTVDPRRADHLQIVRTLLNAATVAMQRVRYRGALLALEGYCGQELTSDGDTADRI